MTISVQAAVRTHIVGTMGYTAERLAISELIGAYGLYYDTGQWDVFGELFVADASYNITPDPNLIPLPLRGAAAIRDEMRERRRKSGDSVFPRHLATNIVFRHIDGEQAGTTSFLVVTFTYPDGGIEMRRAGNYVDEFLNEDGRWRFASRHLFLDTAAAPPMRG